MARKLKPSQRLMFVSLGIGTVLSFGIWLLFGGPWWIYPIIALVICGWLYEQLLGHYAKEAEIDRGHE